MQPHCQAPPNAVGSALNTPTGHVSIDHLQNCQHTIISMAYHNCSNKPFELALCINGQTILIYNVYFMGICDVSRFWVWMDASNFKNIGMCSACWIMVVSILKHCSLSTFMLLLILSQKYGNLMNIILKHSSELEALGACAVSASSQRRTQDLQRGGRVSKL